MNMNILGDFQICISVSLVIPLFDTAQKRGFPLRISPVNMTKSAGNGDFGHIY